MDIDKKILQNFKATLKSSPCPCCKELSLDIIRIKSIAGTDTALFVLTWPTKTELKQHNGSVIKTDKHPFNTDILDDDDGAEPIVDELYVYCFDCSWIDEIIPKGNRNPNGINYTPNALTDTVWKVPHGRCLMRLKTARRACNVGVEKGHLCKKHDNKENKRILKNWFSLHRIKSDLT